MRIGELGVASGLTTKTLRFYEQAGLLPAPRRRSSGYRDYDDRALPRLRFIRSAQACGLTLAEVRQIIALREHGEPPCEHVTELLAVHAAELDQRIADLTSLRREIQRLRERAHDLDPAECRADEVCQLIPTNSNDSNPIHAPSMGSAGVTWKRIWPVAGAVRLPARTRRS